MPMTTVKRDSHGLYVRTDGQVFRPVYSESSYTISHVRNSKEDGSSEFAEGVKVNATHRSGTPFATVKAGDILEWWHAHGMYRGKQSEDCWTPRD